MSETRVYPARCTSAFCGQTECGGCPYKPVLDEFKEWKERTGAVRKDAIWCPTVYTATR